MPTRKEILERLTPLARALSAAQFAEFHARVLEAPPDQVWAALHALRWRDLKATLPLMGLRTGFLGVTALSKRIVDPPSPVAPLVAEEPRYAASGMIGKPWVPWYERGPEVEDLDDIARFHEPGWLKYGMEWVLTELPGKRTLVETATICEATDVRAERRFGAYWLLIRAFSGLIRLDMLAALAHRLRQRRPQVAAV